MSALAAAIQVLGGVALAPLLPGTIQSLKARLQGRRGPSPLQPYRELRRLWGKSLADPQPTTLVYRLAPCLLAASTGLALLLIPIAGVSPDWGLGDDALVLVGLIALGRFALAAATWDSGSGFALMGSSRDLTLAVFAEALFVLAILLAALPAASTGLGPISAAANGSAIWSEPAHWCAAAAFGLVILFETGRQPIDNPDTHLELTMIHEGPLLEYAGRDLALLQWSAAARHWIVLVLAAELFLPHWGGFGARLAELVVGLALLCVALAMTETAQAKMRILRAPGLLAGGCLLALIGLASWLVGGLLSSSAVIAALVALGFGVMLVRRRSLAIVLLTAQSLLLGVAALTLAEESSGLLVAGSILVVRGVALPALLVLARRRTPEPGPVAPTTTVVVRLLVATVVSLLAVASLPPLGLADAPAEHGAFVLLCLGIAIVVMRRPALVQVLGILVAENGVYLLAVSVHGGLPFLVELGVLFDLVLVVAVAVAFTRRIHGELGSGDTNLLRALRD